VRIIAAIVVLGAVALGAPAAMAQREAGSEEARAWLRSLDANGWTRSGLSADERTVTFRRSPETKPDGMVVMWERYERRDDYPGEWRSLVALSEYDCQERRARTLQETTYSEPNLGGRAATASMPGDWTYPIPGSMMESSMRVACEPPRSKAKAAATAAETKAAPAAATVPGTRKTKRIPAAGTAAATATGAKPTKTTAAAPAKKTAAAKKKTTAKKKPPAEPREKFIPIPPPPPPLESPPT
jgi:hypothetical protein